MKQAPGITKYYIRRLDSTKDRGHPHGHCGPSPSPLSSSRSTTCQTNGLSTRATHFHSNSQRIACVGRHGVKQTRANTPRRPVAGGAPTTNKLFEPPPVRAQQRLSVEGNPHLYFFFFFFLSLYFFFFGYFSVISFVRPCKEPGLAVRLFYRLEFTLVVVFISSPYHAIDKPG